MRNILYTLVLLAVFLIGSKFIITSKYKSYINESYDITTINPDSIQSQDYLLISETENPFVIPQTTSSYSKQN